MYFSANISVSVQKKETTTKKEQLWFESLYTVFFQAVCPTFLC